MTTYRNRLIEKQEHLFSKNNELVEEVYDRVFVAYAIDSVNMEGSEYSCTDKNGEFSNEIFDETVDEIVNGIILRVEEDEEEKYDIFEEILNSNVYQDDCERLCDVIKMIKSQMEEDYKQDKSKLENINTAIISAFAWSDATLPYYALIFLIDLSIEEGNKR